MNFKVLGVNGGNGVVLYPFRDELLCNIEPRSVFVTPEDIQWKLNFKSPIEKKIKDININHKLVDVIVGAPDCGHSSVLSYSRAKKLSDPSKNDSLNIFLFSILEYKPKVFMMENLPKMLETMGSEIEALLYEYDLLTFNESVSAWGNSQSSRVRLVLVGLKKSEGLNKDIFKLPKFGTLKTAGELRSNLVLGKNAHVREAYDSRLCLYYKDQRNLSVKEAKHIWKTEFKEFRKWPVNQGNLVHQPGIYRNLDKDLPLTVRKQNRQFNEDGDILSPREIARIQGVPDYFKLWVDEGRYNYSLNKARITLAKSPPYEIGQWFYKCLTQL
jgi:site-specific DNA-cytosine methylase